MDSASSRLSSLRSVLAAGGRRAGHESSGPTNGVPEDVKPASVLHRVATALDHEASRHSGEAAVEFGKARSILVEHSERALQKLSKGDGHANFEDDDLGALEAIVQFDGSRPAFVLRGGGVDLQHPYLGQWANDIRGGVNAIRRCAGSVGRLEPHTGGPLDYFGTGFVVDRKAGLVLTAGHVLGKIVKRVGRQGSISGGVFKLGDDMRIDFDGEADAHGKRLLKVEAGVKIGIAADAALLAVRALTTAEDAEHAHAELPAQLDRRMEIPAGGKPIAGSLCLIGFPARFEPPRSQPDGHQVDWEWVRFHLTGATQGVKRLAPGLPSRQPDTKATDAGRRFGHDASTAGGNSGSPVIAWKDQDQPAIGVHVSGETFVSNEAELLASIKADFERAASMLKALA
jgi:hypothetical protein